MRNEFKIFDADAHVIYPPELWSRWRASRNRDQRSGG